jgi:hypothetical protein
MNFNYAKGTFSLLLFGASALVSTFAQESDQLTVADLARAHPHTISMAAKVKPSGTAATNTIPGVDTLTTFNGHFSTPGFDPAGNPNSKWFFTMVGQSPNDGGTTRFNAPVIAVSLDLRNADGSPRFVKHHRLYYDGTQYLRPVLNSPVFQNFHYDSSENPTQYADAIQRAEFGDEAEDNWHNLLVPHVRTSRVMKLLRGTYQFALNSDGSCCLFVLVDIDAFVSQLFPPTFPVDNSTVIGAAELAGDITTKDISTFLFPNTFLYFNGDPNNCCVVGFHTIDIEPGVASNGNRERNYVVNYSSWVSPGIFSGGTFADVTALSHEISETFNDPLVVSDGVHGITPWWLSPNGNCQDDLEVGDVIEGLPNESFPITMNGYTYHPQNEALLPWFEFKKHPRSIHGAYSYPDVTVLTALSPVEKANCAP